MKLTLPLVVFGILSFLGGVNAQEDYTPGFVDDFAESSDHKREVFRGGWRFDDDGVRCQHDSGERSPEIRWGLDHFLIFGTEFRIRAEDCDRVSFTFRGEGDALFRLTLRQDASGYVEGRSDERDAVEKVAIPNITIPSLAELNKARVEVSFYFFEEADSADGRVKITIQGVSFEVNDDFNARESFGIDFSEGALSVNHVALNVDQWE